MKTHGFTLIELLIVVAIIGIVVAIAIPNLLVALQKARQKATMSDMRSIGAAIESYVTDLHFVPQLANGPIDGLNDSFFVPFYIKSVPVRDGWNNYLQWEREGSLSDQYSIVSYGRRGETGGPAGMPVWGTFYIVKELTDFNNDIVFSNGIFTFGPLVKN